MPRKPKTLESKKHSITLSVPFFIATLKIEQGNSYLVDAIQTGLWAKKNNINQLTLLKLQEEYEEKITKLQDIITEQGTKLDKLEREEE